MQSIDALGAQVKLIHAESEGVKVLVNSLAPEALDRPSPCEKWNVGQVIAHLIWFAETYGGMMERGLQGDQSPPDGFPEVPGTISGVETDQLYGQSAIHKYQVLGPDLAVAFCRTYDWLNEILRGIGPDDWGKPCYHTHRIRTVESFLTTIVAELAIHGWDVRSTLESSPELSGGCLPVLMGKIPGSRRPWTLAFPKKSASLRPARYRFELMGQGSDAKDIVVEGDKARMEDSGGGSADCSLSGDVESFVLLMHGRLTLASCIASGRFRVEGDADLVSDFDHWLGMH